MHQLFCKHRLQLRNNANIYSKGTAGYCLSALLPMTSSHTSTALFVSPAQELRQICLRHLSGVLGMLQDACVHSCSQVVRGFGQIAAARKSLPPLRSSQVPAQPGDGGIHSIVHSLAGKQPHQQITAMQHSQEDLQSDSQQQHHARTVSGSGKKGRTAAQEVGEANMLNTASLGSCDSVHTADVCSLPPAAAQQDSAHKLDIEHDSGLSFSLHTHASAAAHNAKHTQAQPGFRTIQGALLHGPDPTRLPDHCVTSASNALRDQQPPSSPPQRSNLLQHTLNASGAEEHTQNMLHFAPEAQPGNNSRQAVSAVENMCSPSQKASACNPATGPTSVQMQNCRAAQTSKRVKTLPVSQTKERLSVRAKRVALAPTAAKSRIKRRNTKASQGVPADDPCLSAEDSPVEHVTAHRAKRQCRQRTAALIESSADSGASDSDSDASRGRPAALGSTAAVTRQAQAEIARQGSRTLRSRSGTSAVARTAMQADNGSSAESNWSDASSGTDCEEQEAVPDSPTEPCARTAGKGKLTAGVPKSKAASTKPAGRKAAKVGGRSGLGGSSNGRGGSSGGRGGARGGKGGVVKPAAKRQNFVRNNLKV